MESQEEGPEAIYRDLNIRERVQAELKMLSELADVKSKSAVRFGKLRVEILMDSSKYSFKLMNEQIVFELALGRAFPVSKPRLYLRTGLFQPFINDLRDLLDDVLLPDTWNHKMSLANVAKKLPSFLQRLSSDAHNALLVQKMGKFYLGERFTLPELAELKPLELFQSFKLETDRIAMHYLGISDTHLFLFVPNLQPNVLSSKLHVPSEAEIKYLSLFQFAQIQAVNELRLNREESQMVLILKTHRQKKLTLEPTILRLTYRVVNARGLQRKLLKSLPKFQSTTVDYQTARKDEFTPIMASIKQAEQNLQRYLNKDSITQLNKCYQNAVEYLSGNNDPVYLVYLNKIAQLFLREDVKLVSGIKI